MSIDVNTLKQIIAQVVQEMATEDQAAAAPALSLIHISEPTPASRRKASSTGS